MGKLTPLPPLVEFAGFVPLGHTGVLALSVQVLERTGVEVVNPTWEKGRGGHPLEERCSHPRDALLFFYSHLATTGVAFQRPLYDAWIRDRSRHGEAIRGPGWRCARAQAPVARGKALRFMRTPQSEPKSIQKRFSVFTTITPYIRNIISISSIYLRLKTFHTGRYTCTKPVRKVRG